MVRKKLIAVAATVTALALAVPSAAFASHFRSSFGHVAINGSTLTWTVDEAWRKGSDDELGSPAVRSVPNPTGGSITAPGAGSDTGLGVTTVATYDTTEPLYDRTIETHDLDLSSLTEDGTYELYAQSCCRVEGVTNTDGNDSFSQWMRFTKTGSSYNLPPDFDNPSLYLLIVPGVDTTIDFSATDPEGGAVSYEYITNTSGPYYGGTTMPCSSFSAGILTLSPTNCAAGEVFSEIYTPGSFWTAKVAATDPQGNAATVDTLMRVLSPPEGEIDDDTAVGNGLSYSLDLLAEDTVVDSWTVVCTNNADSNDVLTVTGATSPLTVGRLANGATYSCDVTATNQAGSYTNDQDYEIGPAVLSGVDLQLDLAVGANFEGADTLISGGNLMPQSVFDLTMFSDPLVLYQGLTDANGNFTNTVYIPADACLVGVHRLVLTGINPQGEVVSDTVWVELGTDCSILQLSRDEVQPTITTTDDSGLPNTGLVWATFVAVMMMGIFLFFMAGGAFGAKGRLRLASIDVQLRERLSRLNATFERMDRREKYRRWRQR